MGIGRLIARLARQVFKKEIAKVHTHLPAKIVSYTPETNLVSIQPCINQFRTEDPDNPETIQLPVIEDVPVHQLGSGLVLATCAPIAGSYGVFHVCEREINTWITQGGIVDPASSRKFDISDGFFVPGLWPLIDPIVDPIRTDRVELRTRVGSSYVAVLDTGAIEIS